MLGEQKHPPAAVPLSFIVAPIRRTHLLTQEVWEPDLRFRLLTREARVLLKRLIARASTEAEAE